MAQHLLRRGRDVPLLTFADWAFEDVAYSGPVLLLYGRDSVMNPNHSRPAPAGALRRTFPKHSIAEVQGSYGKLYAKENVGSIAAELGVRCKTALAPPHRPADVFAVEIIARTPWTLRPGETTALPVLLTNIGDVSVSSDASGALLGTYWSDDGVLDMLRSMLAARAGRRGGALNAAALTRARVIVDGAQILPQVGASFLRFTMPATKSDAWLVSPTIIPAEIGLSPDLRPLGLAVKGLTIDDGYGAPSMVRVDDPRLNVGFHNIEGEGDALQRWTAGRALLPAGLWDGLSSDFFLRVNLAWSPPT